MIANTSSFEEFLLSIGDASRQQDCRDLAKALSSATGTQPVMWGKIIGFGTHHYIYESGREGDTVAVGFASRKQGIVMYGILNYEDNKAAAQQLGKVSFGKGCIYINKLADIDLRLLKKLAKASFIERNNSR